MSNEATEDAASDTAISFAEFLESVPPGQMKPIEELRSFGLFDLQHNPRNPSRPVAYLRTPELSMHCTNDECGGLRFFRRSSSGSTFMGALEVAPGVGTSDIFINYTCSNCQKSQKTFSLRMSFPTRDDVFGDCIKFGEIPPYGSLTPTRLLRLFGEDRGIFLKGRQCENQGLGIGAFCYYRRIVEGHKNQILDEILKVAKKVAPEMVEAFEAAKNENQFLRAIESIKGAIPPALLIDGHNPLTLLHAALSRGLHAKTDARCLELAHDVRLVLADLAERIGQALKDEAELAAAISRLTKPDEA